MIITTEREMGIILTSLTAGKFITIIDKRGKRYNGKHLSSFKNSYTIKRYKKQSNFTINSSFIKEVKMDGLIYEIQ